MASVHHLEDQPVMGSSNCKGSVIQWSMLCSDEEGFFHVMSSGSSVTSLHLWGTYGHQTDQFLRIPPADPDLCTDWPPTSLHWSVPQEADLNIGIITEDIWGFPKTRRFLIGKLFRMFLSGTWWYTIKFQGNLFFKIKRDTHTYAIASAQIVKLGISLSLSLYIFIYIYMCGTSSIATGHFLQTYAYICCFWTSKKRRPRHAMTMTVFACAGRRCIPSWLPAFLVLDISAGWWLTYPCEKYESQLGWWNSQYMEK